MPYRKKSRKTRKPRRRIYRRRKTTQAKVKAMIRHALKPHQRIMRLHNYGNQIAISANYYITNLTKIAAADRVFNSIAAAEESRNAKHVSMRLDVILQAYTETDGTSITCYIVSPKANTEDSFFDGGSGGLTLGASGTTYQTMSGQAYVNPEYFKIYMRKKVFFPPTGAADVRNVNTMSKRFTFNMKCGWNIRNTTASSWGNLVCPNLPAHNVYLLVFNDNSLVDAEWPTVSYTVLNTYVSS